MSTEDRELREKTLRDVVLYLSQEDWRKSTAEVCTNVHRIVKRDLGVSDPYKKLKEEINRKVSGLYPSLRRLVERSEDPFLTAVKVAIAGNAIDLGPKIDFDIEDEVNRVLNREFFMDEPDRLKSLALRYGRVLYLADNAGETFFDRILVEEQTRFQDKVPVEEANHPSFSPYLDPSPFHVLYPFPYRTLLRSQSA